ncbi:hypothetical protein PACTADRAFT_76547 [Pachysolen tannophilus NRRL Y-2460]|uniref:DNA topoisomerase n=1 Tax=Pachysolen tannophilus NRRL Y-2460 TaxID=669874 RepID=A0A1E4TT56_PACTA|nr:hypothetical protein PACTADRAFT_76547 [Pachysolen tannophilus NRRL Y-2460]
MRVLCVAEKPSIAKSVAHTLSGGNVTQVRNSNNKYIKNYDFKFNFGNDIGLSEVTMTSVTGHLSSTDFAAQYAWAKCTPSRLFDAPTIEKIDDNEKKIADNIAKEARYANYLMIWTDCDREGEYIGYEIVKAARTSNSNITLENTLRAQFSHLERTHIVRAAKNPIRLDQNAIAAVATRMELDLRTGASFTRFLTNLYQSKCDKDFGVISYGGCQFPTLGFIVDRYKRVKNFISEPFWYIDLDLRKDGQKVTFRWLRPHIFDRLTAVLFYERSFLEANDRGIITKIESKPTKNWRPLPLTTVELQKNCSKYLRMSAKQVLDCAEKLYNQGYVSYPRTETDSFPKAMDLKDLISKQTQNSQWGTYASDLINNDKFKQPRSGNHDDKAHPPIHPIMHSDGSNLSANEKKIYEYIVRHFLACCSDDGKGSSTTVTLKWGIELFQASGLVVLEKNYLDIYPYYKWESSKQLPKFEPNEPIKITKVELASGETSPPTHMTEAELIALMDANGIGTDATIADHIEKIVARSYVNLQTAPGRGTTKYFVPTVLGMALVDGFNQIGLDNISLSKPFLRKNLELKLKGIVEGSCSRNQVLHEMLDMYRQAFALSNQKQDILVTAYRDSNNLY